MRVLIQRVSEASVIIENEMTGNIEQGLLLFVGIEKHDNNSVAERMAEKLLAYRAFNDLDGRMNCNVKEIAGGVLAVSQFTLAADTSKGLRPGFSKAATPDQAKPLYQHFVEHLRSLHSPVASGVFAADMKVHLVNDGPVTFLLQA